MPGSGFVTIGGGGASSHNRPGRSAGHNTADMTFDNESEEHIVKKANDVKMQPLHAAAGAQGPQNAIVVSKQVTVTTEEFGNEPNAGSFQRV